MRKPRLIAMVLFCGSFLLLLASPKSGEQEKPRLQNLRTPGIREYLIGNQLGGSYWARTYGTPDQDVGNTVRPTPDGGFICAGQTWSYPNDNVNFSYADTLILKLDPAGQIEWKKIYRGQSIASNARWRSYERVIEPSAIPAWDGGYIVASEISSSGGPDIWILKLYPNGDIDWQKSYGTANSERVRGCIQPTNDGGYVLAGETSDDRFQKSIWVLKLDSRGDIQWQRAYGDFGESGLYDAYATSIFPTGDGGYVLGGDVDSPNRFSSWAAKLSSKGDIEWQKLYTNYAKFYEGGPIVRPTRDGGFIFADFTESSGSGQPAFGNADFLILKLFPDGTIDWQKIIGASGYEYPQHSVLETQDGCFVIAGSSRPGVSLQTVYFKLSPAGELIWQRQLESPGHNHLFGMQELEGGNFILTGFWSLDLCVFTLNPEGNCTPCNLVQTADLKFKEAAFIPRDTSVVPRPTEVVPQDTVIVPEDVPLKTEVLCWNLNQPPQNVSCTQEINRSLFRKEYFNRIRWEPNPHNSQFSIVEYRVYRTLLTRERELFATINPSKREFLDSEVRKGNGIYYEVSSVDSEGHESPKSTPIFVLVGGLGTSR